MRLLINIIHQVPRTTSPGNCNIWDDLILLQGFLIVKMFFYGFGLKVLWGNYLFFNIFWVINITSKFFWNSTRLYKMYNFRRFTDQLLLTCLIDFWDNLSGLKFKVVAIFYWSYRGFITSGPRNHVEFLRLTPSIFNILPTKVKLYSPFYEVLYLRSLIFVNLSPIYRREIR